MRKFIFIIVLSSIVASLFAPPAFAAVPLNPLFHPENAPTITGEAPTITGEAPTGTAEAEINPDKARIKFTKKIVNVVLGIAGIVAIFFILNSAIFIVASAGKEEVITQHKKGLMWAIIGLILIILSYSIIRFIISIPFSADQAPAESTTPATTPAAPSGQTGGAASGQQPAGNQVIDEEDPPE